MKNKRKHKTYHRNYILKAKNVAALAGRYYQEGEYARSYHSVWMNHVYKVYPMSYRSFLRCIQVAKEQEGKSNVAEAQEISLFDME